MCNSYLCKNPWTCRVKIGTVWQHLQAKRKQEMRLKETIVRHYTRRVKENCIVFWEPLSATRCHDIKDGIILNCTTCRLLYHVTQMCLETVQNAFSGTSGKRGWGNHVTSNLLLKIFCSENLM